MRRTAPAGPGGAGPVAGGVDVNVAVSADAGKGEDEGAGETGEEEER